MCHLISGQTIAVELIPFPCPLFLLEGGRHGGSMVGGGAKALLTNDASKQLIYTMLFISGGTHINNYLLLCIHTLIIDSIN